jgi:hypothetical protein
MAFLATSTIAADYRRFARRIDIGLISGAERREGLKNPPLQKPFRRSAASAIA